MDKKYILIIVLVAVAAFLLGNFWQKPSASPASDQKRPQKVQLNQAERDAKKLARQTKRDHKLEQQVEKRTRQKSTETDAEKTAKKLARREQKTDQRLSEKAWWNKKGGKFKNISLNDETKALMDGSVVQLLEIRKQLGAELLAAKQANQTALAIGDTTAITTNLQQIEAIQARWLAARNQVILDMVANLTPEQLQALSESGGDVAALNWMDFSLEKGMDNIKSKKQSTRQNKTPKDQSP